MLVSNIFVLMPEGIFEPDCGISFRFFRNDSFLFGSALDLLELSLNVMNSLVQSKGARYLFTAFALSMLLFEESGDS